jgi:hypothetical protein
VVKAEADKMLDFSVQVVSEAFSGKVRRQFQSALLTVCTDVDRLTFISEYDAATSNDLRCSLGRTTAGSTCA